MNANFSSMLEEESAARVQKTQAELARPRRMSGLAGNMPPGQRRGSAHKENKWAMAINKQVGANKAAGAFSAAAAMRRMSFEKDDSQRLNVGGRKSSFASQSRNSEDSLEGVGADGPEDDYQRNRSQSVASLSIDVNAIKKYIPGQRKENKDQMLVSQRHEDLVKIFKLRSLLEQDGGIQGKGSDEDLKMRFELSQNLLFAPDAEWLQNWDILMVMLVVLVGIITPADLSFEFPKDVTLVWFFRLSDILFILDIFIRFNTSYPVGRRKKFEMSRWAICNSYLRSWFAVDFISSIPGDLIVDFIDSSGGISVDVLAMMKLVRLLRLLKLNKLLRFSDVGSRWKRWIYYSREGNLVRLVMLLVGMLVMVHFMACIWNSMGHAWWFFEHPLRIEDDATRLTKYVTCYYAALLMITGSDVYPQSHSEKLFVCVSLIFGAIFLAILFGNVSVLVHNFTSSSTAYNRKMQFLYHHMSNMKLPRIVRDRVTFYYRTIWTNYHSLDGNVASYVSELSRPLSDEVFLFLRTKLILGAELFKTCSAGVVYELVVNLEQEIYLPLDLVVTYDGAGRAMYFIQQGVCDVILPKTDLPEYSKGRTSKFSIRSSKAGAQIELSDVGKSGGVAYKTTSARLARGFMKKASFDTMAGIARMGVRKASSLGERNRTSLFSSSPPIHADEGRPGITHAASEPALLPMANAASMAQQANLPDHGGEGGVGMDDSGRRQFLKARFAPSTPASDGGAARAHPPRGVSFGVPGDMRDRDALEGRPSIVSHGDLGTIPDFGGVTESTSNAEGSDESEGEGFEVKKKARVSIFGAMMSRSTAPRAIKRSMTSPSPTPDGGQPISRRRGRPSGLRKFTSNNLSSNLDNFLYKKKKVVENDDSGEQVVRTLKAGESFGDIALLMNVKRTASVRAQTVVQLCVLTDEKLVTISKKYHEMSEVITKALKDKGNKYRGMAVKNAFRKFVREHSVLEQDWAERVNRQNEGGSSSSTSNSGGRRSTVHVASGAKSKPTLERTGSRRSTLNAKHLSSASSPPVSPVKPVSLSPVATGLGGLGGLGALGADMELSAALESLKATSVDLVRHSSEEEAFKEQLAGRFATLSGELKELKKAGTIGAPSPVGGRGGGGGGGGVDAGRGADVMNLGALAMMGQTAGAAEDTTAEEKEQKTSPKPTPKNEAQRWSPALSARFMGGSPVISERASSVGDGDGDD